MPPARTGVADYAEALLAALRTQGPVNRGQGDVNLYHLGNNQLHAEIYRRALAQPGVVVLHDAVLHHFCLGLLSRDEYVEEFVYNYGEWTRALAEDLWTNRARSAADPRYFAWPMLRRITERSLAVVVHNPAAAEIVRSHAPDARIHEIPHLWVPTAQFPQNASPRLLCGVFGHLRESKRLPVVLEACKRAGVDLMVAGSLPTELERALRPAMQGIRREPYATRERFLQLAHEVDCCINLRYPPAGETSGIGVLLMGIGRPVVFTDGEEIARYPGDACIRIDSGVAEREHLADALTWLRIRRSHARAIGSNASEYIRREHAAERVARLYQEALRSA
jgi:hypothetical protein